MKYIKITLLLAFAASSTLHGFIPGDAASAGTSNNTPTLPPCAAIEKGLQYHHLMQAGQSAQETFAINGSTHSDAASAGTPGTSKEPEQSQELAADKKFMCPVCGKKIKHKVDFRRHILVHTKVKPFKCEHPGCPYAGRHPWHLKSHMQGHANTKPFKCEHPRCPYATNWKGDLNTHYKNTHGGKLPDTGEESRGAALLLSLTSNPKRTSSGSDPASKRREVSADALAASQQYTSDSESE